MDRVEQTRIPPRALARTPRAGVVAVAVVLSALFLARVGWTLLPSGHATSPSPHRITQALQSGLYTVAVSSGFCLLWPPLRRRTLAMRRGLGRTFLLAGLASVALSLAAQHGGLVLHLGDWSVAAVASLALVAGAMHGREHDHARHLGWASVAFGCLLAAPVGRADRILLGALFPDQALDELNHAVTVVLFTQALLLGYALLCLNRATSPIRGGLPGPGIAWVRPVGTVLWLVAALSLAHHELVAGGLTPRATLVMPPPFAAYLQARGGALPQMCAAAAMGVVASVALLRARFRVGNGLAVFALVTSVLVYGTVHLFRGFELGGPSHVRLGGGAFDLAIGWLVLVFGGLAGAAALRGRRALTEEWALFAGLYAAAPALVPRLLEVFATVGAVPPAYVAEGRAYELAVALALLAATFTGFVRAVYGAATHERALV